MTEAVHIENILVAFAACVVIAACSSIGSGSGRSGYVDDLEKLRIDCTARGGILQPIPGAVTGNPGADNICQIRGAATPWLD